MRTVTKTDDSESRWARFEVPPESLWRQQRDPQIIADSPLDGFDLYLARLGLLALPDDNPSSWIFGRSSSGLFLPSGHINPHQALRFFLDNKSAEIDLEPSSLIERPSVGGIDIEHFLNTNRFGVVPIRLTSNQEPLGAFFSAQKGALYYLETLESATQALDSGAISASERIVLSNEFKQILSAAYDSFIKAYECWWRLASEEGSLSQMRTESLVNKTIKTMSSGDKPPWVVKLTLPFSKWNSLLGEISANQIKWYLLSALKREMAGGEALGKVCFIDGTGISILFDADEFSPTQITTLMDRCNELLISELFCRISQGRLSKQIREGGRGFEVLNDDGRWIPLSLLFSNDVYAGAAQVNVKGLSQNDGYQTEDAVRRAVHKTEILARARAEAAQKNSQSQGTMTSSQNRFDWRSTKKDLSSEWGKGYFPEGVIPTKEDLCWAVFTAFYRFGFMDSPSAESLLQQKKKGLLQILRLADLASTKLKQRKGGEEGAVSSLGFMQSLFDDLASAHDANDQNFQKFLENTSYNTDVFFDVIHSFIVGSAKEQMALHSFLSLASARLVSHEAGDLAGNKGALTTLGAVMQTESSKPLPKATIPDLTHALSRVPWMLTRGMSEALMDARFPGKIKTNAFERVIANHFQGDFHLFVFDYDNLASFLKNPENRKIPDQPY
ncbi:MAG TPA: hypothetical protein VJC18_10825, partial [bacterium]|nr:hypothetical protein [bacterium]